MSTDLTHNKSSLNNSPELLTHLDSTRVNTRLCPSLTDRLHSSQYKHKTLPESYLKRLHLSLCDEVLVDFVNVKCNPLVTTTPISEPIRRFLHSTAFLLQMIYWSQHSTEDTWKVFSRSSAITSVPRSHTHSFFQSLIKLDPHTLFLIC